MAIAPAAGAAHVASFSRHCERLGVKAFAAELKSAGRRLEVVAPKVLVRELSETDL